MGNDRRSKERPSLNHFWDEIGEDVVSLSANELKTEIAAIYGDPDYLVKRARSKITLPSSSRRKQILRGSQLRHFAEKALSFFFDISRARLAFGVFLGACLTTGLAFFFVEGRLTKLEQAENAVAATAKNLVKQAIVEFANTRDDAAMAYLNQALVLDPNNSAYRNFRGVLFAEDGLHIAAMSDFNIKYKDEKEFAWSLNNIGVVKQEMNLHSDLMPGEEGKYDPIEDLRRSATLAKFAMPHKNLGIILFDNSEYHSALDEFNIALRFDKTFVDALVGRAGTEVALNMAKDAVTDYSAVIARYPRHAVFYRLRSLAYSQLGNERFAKRDIEAARRLNMREADFFYDPKFSRLQKLARARPAAAEPPFKQSEHPSVETDKQPEEETESAPEERASFPLDEDSYRESLYCSIGASVNACLQY